VTFPARAQQPVTPVIPVLVEYSAPTPECAPAEAFQRLLEIEVARSPSPRRSWRFSILVRRLADSYEGTLTTETGVRTVTAARCDDVTASLALIVAMADSSPAAPPEPLPAEPPPPAPAIAPALMPPSPPSTEAVKSADAVRDRSADEAPLEWRIGVRPFASDHGTDSPTLGILAFGSVELPWGLRKMMFEIGGGTFSDMFSGVGPVSAPAPGITYLVLDTQACLLDVPLGDFGVSVLGCLRVAGASFKAGPTRGGAFWTGGGARLRWQTPVHLFIEANLDAVYGTVSGGESVNPGWLDIGVALGVRL